MDEQTRQIRMAELARDILVLSRNTLLVNLRFLDAAVSRLEPVPNPFLPLAVDGRHLFYEPSAVLQAYKNEPAGIVHDWLHVLLHCVFRHM